MIWLIPAGLQNWNYDWQNWKVWHLSRNGDNLPTSVSAFSPKKVWWICPHGHSYYCSAGNRTRLGTGCGVCSSRQIDGTNNLAILFPDIATEWHPVRNQGLNPYGVASGSQRTVWWQCAYGHEWKTSISNRTRQGTKCPECRPRTSRPEIFVYTELKTIFDDIEWRGRIEGREADVILTNERVAIEIDGSKWHQGTTEKDLRKTRLFESVGYLVFRVREGDLPALSPYDIKFPIGRIGPDAIVSLLKNIRACCDLNGFLLAKIEQYIVQNKQQNKMEYDKLISALPGPPSGRSLSDLYPHLAEEWDINMNHPFYPKMFTPGSGHKAWWKCKEHGSFSAAIFSRTRKSGTRCPYCAGQKVAPSMSFAARHPNIAAFWHPTLNGTLTASDVSASSNRCVWWRCANGHEWQAAVRAMSARKKDNYCRNCQNDGE